jgi:hypothetical protein
LFERISREYHPQEYDRLKLKLWTRHIGYLQENKKWDLIVQQRQASSLLQEGYEILMNLLDKQKSPNTQIREETQEQIEEMKVPI